MNQHHLALMARFPSPGQGKTRLIPRLGINGACSFARSALLDQLHLLAKTTTCRRTLFYTPESARTEILELLEHEALSSSWGICLQAQTPDLGGRLCAAVDHVRANFAGTPNDAEQTITFIGMDCFDLVGSVVEESMAAVSANPNTAFMIPACDGGYVLLTVPLDCDAKRVFSDIAWSTDETGHMQMERLAEAGLSCNVGETLPDVDEPADLDSLWQALRAKQKVFPRTFDFLAGVMQK